MAKQITVTGDKELDRKLATFEKRIQKKMIRKSLRAIAKPVLESAQNWAPDDTGALEASLKLRAIKRSRHTVGVRVMTGADTLNQGDNYYGSFQELGTSRMDANPFLLPAKLENEGNVKAKFSQHLSKLMREEGV